MTDKLPEGFVLEEDTALPEGFVLEDSPSVVADVAKSGASGVARGIADIAGLPGTLSDAFDRGMNFAMRKGYQLATGEEPTQGSFFAGIPEERINNPMSGQKARAAIAALSGGATDYQPQTIAGEYARTVGEFAPGAAALGGVNPANLARFAALPGLASEAAGQATKGTAVEPYARIGAALAAPAAPAVAARAISPLRIDPARRAAANVLRREGVRPTAGQVTGSRGLRYQESELGGNKAVRLMDEQKEAFTSAALRRAGGAGRATPENMQAISERIGQTFDDLAARNTLVADRQLVAQFDDVMREYGRILPSEQKKIIANIADDIRNKFSGGRMSGKDYQSIRSRLTKRAQNARGVDNDAADAYRGMRNALDDAMDRSIRPEDAGAWAQVRREYGNYKTLERAAAGAGEDAAAGIISPAKLRMAAAAGKNKGQYVRGQGDFADLARAGNEIMTPLPQSGTTPRLMAQGAGAGMGATVGAMTGGPVGALAGGALGVAAPRAAGQALMSRPVQAYLMNQTVRQPNVVMDPRYLALIEALYAGRAGTPSQ